MYDNDKPKFRAGLAAMLKATNDQNVLTADQFEPYWLVLRRYLLKDVQSAMARAFTVDGHISPARLRDLVNPTVPAEESQNPAMIAERDAKPAGPTMVPLAEMTSFDLMKLDASAAFSRKVCGQAPNESEQVYGGPFDYRATVHATKAPKSARPRDHDESWARFFDLLRYEWAIFQKVELAPQGHQSPHKLR